eukprot:202371-Pelagomonas_calceolata.AAC.3
MAMVTMALHYYHMKCCQEVVLYAGCELELCNARVLLFKLKAASCVPLEITSRKAWPPTHRFANLSFALTRSPSLSQLPASGTEQAWAAI